jgi:parallel beta-helix repeat protein
MTRSTRSSGVGRLAIVFGVLLAVSAAASALPAAARATTLYVSVVGSDTGGYGSLAHPYATVQKAVNVAGTGDVVHVGPGMFRGDVVMKAGVSLYGAGASLTTLRGTGTERVITATNIGSDVTISGFTITGGVRDGGGGIGCDNHSALTIMGNTITGNRADVGGGIYCGLDSSPTIMGNAITGNSAGLGGGIYCGFTSSPIITGNSISSNNATGTYAQGGGIFCADSSVVIAGNIVAGNTADNSGGGIYCWQSSPRITGNTITGDTSVDGGGVYCNTSSPTIMANTIVGNSSYAAGGGIYSGYSSLPTITNNVIAGNTAVTIGGGVFLGVGTGTKVCNDTITGNRAKPGGGGGIYSVPGTPTITNCILWGDSDELFGCTATNSDISASGAGLGNISTDPHFVAPESGNFHISAGSPCIDDASPTAAPSKDRDGIARPWGWGYDMGAYEYFVPVIKPTTTISGPTSVRVNRPLKLTGTVSTALTPASPPGKVTITKTLLVGSTWKSAGSATVSVVKRAYSYAFTPTAKRKWRFVATYSGGVLGPTKYANSKSLVKGVTVN